MLNTVHLPEYRANVFGLKSVGRAGVKFSNPFTWDWDYWKKTIQAT